jgi:hypothetical protein
MLGLLTNAARFGIPIAGGFDPGQRWDGFRTMFDLGTAIAGPQAYLGGQILLGRDDSTAAGTLDEAREQGLMPPKPGPKKIEYPKAGDPVYQTQAPTPEAPLPAPPMSLQPTESVPGAPAAPVLPPPTTPEIAPVAPGYERDYAGQTTGLLGQLNAMEKANMDKLGMSYQGLEESDALLDKMIKEKKK